MKLKVNKTKFITNKLLQAIENILYGFVDFNMQHIEDTCQFVIRIQCFEDMILSQFDFFVT